MNIFEKLKNIKFKEVIYPVIIVLFFLSVAVFFFMIAHSLTGAINKVFNIKEKDIEAKLVAFKIEEFNKLKKRLKIDEEASKPAAVSPPPLPLLTSPLPTAAPTPPTPAPEPDKKTLKIQILNGTKTKGLAKTLASQLETAGFLIADTGNADKTSYQTAVIKTKNSKKDFIALVEIQLKDYSIGLKEALDEGAEYDMIIVIGQK